MEGFVGYIRELILYMPAILIAITFHEYAHAYAAYKLGDPTAKNEGRLTLNPLKHIDIVGLIVFILLKFGWAKPVPVNMYNLRNPIRDMGIIAFAGPLSNFILSFVSLLFLAYMGSVHEILRFLLLSSFQINLVFGLFNLLPFPPLDGWRILTAFYPKLMLEPKYEFYGFIALMFIVIFFGEFISLYLYHASSIVVKIFSIFIPV